MRKFIVSIMLASAAVAAVPAAAAPAWRAQPFAARQIQKDINQFDNRIDKAVQQRRISRREATSLRRQAASLQQLYYGYRRNGLDRAEVRTLETRIDRLGQSLRAERRDNDGRRR